MDGTCGTHRRTRKAYRVLGGKSKQNKALGRSGCKWESNIKMCRTEVGCELMCLSGGPIVGCCENGKELWLTEWSSLSRTQQL